MSVTHPGSRWSFVLSEAPLVVIFFQSQKAEYLCTWTQHFCHTLLNIWPNILFCIWTQTFFHSSLPNVVLHLTKHISYFILYYIVPEPEPFFLHLCQTLFYTWSNIFTLYICAWTQTFFFWIFAKHFFYFTNNNSYHTLEETKSFRREDNRNQSHLSDYRSKILRSQKYLNRKSYTVNVSKRRNKFLLKLLLKGHARMWSKQMVVE